MVIGACAAVEAAAALLLAHASGHCPARGAAGAPSASSRAMASAADVFLGATQGFLAGPICSPRSMSSIARLPSLFAMNNTNLRMQSMTMV